VKERERRGIRNSSIGSDWCVLLASLTPPYIVMGGQGFHHLGGGRGRRASLIRPSPR